MKNLFFILTTFFFISSSSLAADCSFLNVDPKITIKSSYGKLNYDTSKTTKEITNIAKKFNLVETGLFASGLSTVNVNFDITINTFSNIMGNSEFCVTPTEVIIFLGLENPTIYLSKELSQNSCQYNVVLRHEKVHQQINKSTLEYYLPLFKKSVTSIIKKIRPIHVSDINNIKNATAELTKIYNKKLTPLVNYIKKEMLTEQQKLDNPNNYHYENSLCL
ncbi:MAG: hypothetical protein E7020_05040 [Alphaproteobacteria bacterium]|nr:hypothetical protein [Alphaproteobacteria bacterium]